MRFRYRLFGFALLATLLPVSGLFATTHYIDFSAGSDSNAGTSETSPWKHAPKMTGCSSNCANYTPAAGDRIIFRGGVTWDNTALPLAPSNSGSSGSPIYYGVDITWFTGTNSGTVNTNGTIVTWASGNAFLLAWAGGLVTINGTGYTIASVQGPYQLTLTTSAGTQSGVAYSNSLFKRPIFDGKSLATGILNVSGSYLTFDSLEFTGQIANTSSDYVAYVAATNGNILLENMDIHGWKRCLGSGNPTATCTGAVSDNSNVVNGVYAALYGGLSPSGMEVLNSNIGGDSVTDSGGLRGWQIVISSYLHDMSFGDDHGGQLIHDNIFYNIGATFDRTTHTDVTYLDCFDQQCGSGLSTLTAYIYNNWIINTVGNSTATQIYPNPGSAGVTGTVAYYIFNNVISNTGSGAGFEGNDIDPYGASGSLTMKVYDWNNTYNLVSGGICVQVDSRTYPMTVVDVRNLHCIAMSGTTFNPDGTISPYSLDLLLQSVSTANGQGYVAPTWAPTSPSASTVGTGTNLTSFCSGSLTALCSTTTLGGTLASTSRPSTGAWDEGAYLYVADPPSAPTNLTAVPK
jgi:hypothetical protein